MKRLTLFVRLSVRMSHGGIVSKRLNISQPFSPSDSSTIPVFFRTKRNGNIRTGTPVMGASNACVWKNRAFRSISLYLWNDTR